jgi:hypothetical protein
MSRGLNAGRQYAVAFLGKPFGDNSTGSSRVLIDVCNEQENKELWLLGLGSNQQPSG